MLSAPLPRHWPTLILGTTALVAVALAASAARGQENTSTTILVTATVESACTLQTDEITLDFGIFTGAALNKTASFSYDCPAGKNLTFTLTGGQGADAGGLRELPHRDIPASASLFYTIFDPNSNAWTNGYDITTSGGSDTRTFSATLNSSTLDNVSPGVFQDTITLEMTVNN